MIKNLERIYITKLYNNSLYIMKRIITKYIPGLKINLIYKLESETNNFESIYHANPEDILFRLSESSYHVIACFKNLTYNTLDDEMPNYYNLIFDDLDESQKKQILKQGALICKQYSRLGSKKNAKVSYTKIKNICDNDMKSNILLFKSKTITV